MDNKKERIIYENAELSMRYDSVQKRNIKDDDIFLSNGLKGLSYVATSNSTNSKWCPWELGHFDGKKNGRCCILPIMESQTFQGQEYLGLYPYMQYAQVSGKEKYEFWVYNQGTNKYVILRKWLDGSNPYKH